MNKEQFEKLKPYEHQLTQAYKGRFLVGMGSKTISELIDAYNEVFGATKVYTTCNHCLYKIVFRLGEEYFKYQEQHPEVTPTAPEEKPVNKRGRKKKEE